jgi:hypothetical protein
LGWSACYIEYHLDQLRAAIEATFSRRNTALPATLPIGLSENFVADAAKQTQWKIFLKKNQLGTLSLDDVVHSLGTSLRRTGLV